MSVKGQESLPRLLLVRGLETTWLPTILLPSGLLSGARKREVGQRKGLERGC